MIWQKLTKQAIQDRVFSALNKNRNYDSDTILGIPGTYLDTEQFYREADFLANAPYLSTLINNPNHIGCHTLTEEESEDMFRGTQKIEIELIRLVSEDILYADPKSIDGYIAPGGTEANIQAMWIYRNFYMHEFGANHNEIAVVFSSDSHYSMFKGANLLNIRPIEVEVDPVNRQMNQEVLRASLAAVKADGVSHFILIQNMSTTLFGSVDDISVNRAVFDSLDLPVKVHVDGAFGGFIYPFTAADNALDFSNPAVDSITLDAHKMLMAPYGTGMFLIRKGMMHYATTQEAEYVQGLDYTICGSRSGANAVSIWMILQTHGPNGWKSKMLGLIDLTDWFCQRLDENGIRYFRNPEMNIISMDASQLNDEVCRKYRLVADSYELGTPNFWKIVVMPHVKKEVLEGFLSEVV